MILSLPMYLEGNMFSGGPRPERNLKCECGEGEPAFVLLNTKTDKKSFFCQKCIGAVMGSAYLPAHMEWVDMDE